MRREKQETTPGQAAARKRGPDPRACRFPVLSSPPHLMVPGPWPPRELSARGIQLQPWPPPSPGQLVVFPGSLLRPGHSFSRAAM